MSFKRMLILLVVFCMFMFSAIALQAGNLDEDSYIPDTTTPTVLLPDRPMVAAAKPIGAFDEFEKELEALKEAEEKALEEAEKEALEKIEKENQDVKQEQETKPEEKPQEKPKETEEEQETEWDGEVLNARNGIVYGPSGKESYYNLDMSGVIKEMRRLGYSEEEYPYHIREDGVKMLGDYVMCAANLEIRPKGTIVDTTLGKAIVCDTGGFAKKDRTQLDIAVNW